MYNLKTNIIEFYLEVHHTIEKTIVREDSQILPENHGSKQPGGIEGHVIKFPLAVDLLITRKSLQLDESQP